MAPLVILNTTVDWIHHLNSLAHLELEWRLLFLLNDDLWSSKGLSKGIECCNMIQHLIQIMCCTMVVLDANGYWKIFFLSKLFWQIKYFFCSYTFAKCILPFVATIFVDSLIDGSLVYEKIKFSHRCFTNNGFWRAWCECLWHQLHLIPICLPIACPKLISKAPLWTSQLWQYILTFLISCSWQPKCVWY